MYVYGLLRVRDNDIVIIRDYIILWANVFRSALGGGGKLREDIKQREKKITNYKKYSI